jgi:DNA-binding phage protein
VTLTSSVNDPVDAMLPPRSRLYHLAPIGVGTSDVESLTSFIARLAEAHAVSVGCLMIDEILPRLGRRHLIDVKRGASGPQAWRARMQVINGVSPLAADSTVVLETLTGRRDLRLLTMAPWKDGISPRGLLRRTRTWCPACLRARRQHGQVYESLTWMLNPITLCSEHRLRLQDSCPAPHCGRAQPALMARTRPGHCAWCGAWLGAPASSDPSDPRLERWHRWKATMMGRLLANERSLPFESSPNRLSALLEEIGSHGGLRQIAVDSRVSQQTLGLWRAGRVRPTLEMLLRLTYCLEGPSAYAARRIPPRKTSRSLRRVVPTTIPSGRTGYRRFDRAVIGAALNAALVDPQRPSLSAVAHRLGYRRSRLCAAFPGLCAAIAEQRKGARERDIRTRTTKLRAKIRGAALLFRAKRIFPGMDRIAETLGIPRLRVWRALRQDR